jgi:hypothetical protein
MRFPHANVTLLNLGASESTQERGMVVPFFDTGLPNHYGAQLSAESDGLRVLTCAIDSLALTRPVRVLKIEAEGHGAVVISGARALIARNHRRS